MPGLLHRLGYAGLEHDFPRAVTMAGCIQAESQGVLLVIGRDGSTATATATPLSITGCRLNDPSNTRLEHSTELASCALIAHVADRTNFPHIKHHCTP